MERPGRTMRVAWAVVGLLWAVALLNYLDRQLVVTMGRPIKADLGIGDAEFGLFPSLFLWIYGLCSPFAGYVADRVGKRPVIIASLLLWSLATLLTGFVTSFEGMLVARAALGVSEAFYIPAALALIVDYHRGRTRALATGLHLSGVYAGSILGGFGGWLAEYHGWRFGFLLFGGIGVGYALVLMVVMPYPPEDEEAPAPVGGDPATDWHQLPPVPPPVRPPNAFAALLGTRGFVLLLGMVALNGMAFWPLRNWLPTFFNTEMGVSLTWSGIYGATAFNGAAFLGMLFAGVVSDWWSQRNLRARTLVPAFGCCLAAPALFVAGTAEAVPVILAGIMVVGMSQGFLDANLMPAICTVADPRHRATGYGLTNFVGTTMGGVMTFVGGVLKDHQVPFGTSFQAASGFVLVAAVLLFMVRPKAP